MQITATDVADMASRITATYRSATLEQVASGRQWYDSAHEFARDIARQSGISDSAAVGIIAALSPMTSWSLNVRMAMAMATGQTVKGLKRNIAKAEAIRNGAPFADVLPRGSKTWNFAHNIAGDGDKVTIDRWAIRVATGRTVESITPKQYGYIADAYRQAATQCHETPAAMQAITWCVIRGSAS